MSLLAVVACYGTLAVVALLSLVGVSVDVNEALLVKVVTGLLVVAVGGMVVSYRDHRNIGPLGLGVCAAGLLLWVFYGTYSKPLELVGFLLLVAASVYDFLVKKRACSRQRC